MTGFSYKIKILSEFYTNYSQDPEFEEFVEYNDAGLPLAYLFEAGLCELTMEGEKSIEVTWTLLLKTLGIGDADFENLDDMFQASSDGQ